MAARHRNQHDGIARQQPADPMDQRDVEQGPARLRVLDQRGQRLLGHARIVFQRHRGNIAAIVHVTCQADEAGDGADVGAAMSQGVDFHPQLEGFALHHYLHRFSLR